MRLLALLPILALAAPAHARQQGGPPQSPPAETRSEQALIASRATIVATPVAVMIAAFDTDGDARVTHAELDAGVLRSFAATTSGETIGYIEFGDWAKRWLGDANALPSPFETDRNGDNRITAAEMALRFDLLFTEYDKDKDGAISRAELLTIRTPPSGMRTDNRGRLRLDER